MLNKKILGSVSSAPATYVEDVFSTYLYTGVGGSLSIDNGIDLAGEGGLVWEKQRGTTGNHFLWDSARGTNKLSTNLTNAQSDNGIYAPTFGSSGYTSNYGWSSSQNIASWTFRKQPKFFDVVTGTGGGVFNHSLNSVPGMIIIKYTGSTSDWFVVHRSVNGYYLLNTTASGTNTGYPGIATSGAIVNADSTTFDTSNIVTSGSPFVAYLFAHNAGGFGDAGTDNVISCGSFTSDGSGKATINLGYEPQYVLLKRTDYVGDWILMDVMRGMTAPPSTQTFLDANDSNAENSTNIYTAPTSTGMYFSGFANRTFIYMAIRRPMKVPTDATKVFKPVATTDSVNTFETTGFAIDLQIQGYRPGISVNQGFIDRLRGTGTVASSTTSVPRLSSSSTAAQSNASVANGWDNTGFQISSGWDGNNMVYWNFARRPGFFDEVCWTGTSADQTLSHNLSVAPELIIYKARGATSNWYTACNFTSSDYSNLNLNLTNTASTVSYSGGGAFSAQPTSTQFSVGQFYNTSTMVAYLFATCPGVSKVGSYTGTGSTQTINCGFTGGARFVMIKSINNASDWWIWDTARGMVSGTDPSLAFNTTDPEYNFNSVYTATTGFQLLASPGQGVNNSGENYIYLAIA